MTVFFLLFAFISTGFSQKLVREFAPVEIGNTWTYGITTTETFKTNKTRSTLCQGSRVLTISSKRLGGMVKMIRKDSLSCSAVKAFGDSVYKKKNLDTLIYFRNKGGGYSSPNAFNPYFKISGKGVIALPPFFKRGEGSTSLNVDPSKKIFSYGETKDTLIDVFNSHVSNSLKYVNNVGLFKSGTKIDVDGYRYSRKFSENLELIEFNDKPIRLEKYLPVDSERKKNEIGRMFFSLEDLNTFLIEEDFSDVNIFNVSGILVPYITSNIKQNPGLYFVELFDSNKKREIVVLKVNRAGF